MVSYHDKDRVYASLANCGCDGFHHAIVAEVDMEICCCRHLNAVEESRHDGGFALAPRELFKPFVYSSRRPRKCYECLEINSLARRWSILL